MKDESRALKRVYAESSNFIILGLTGRTGSGCSTAAQILERSNPQIPKFSKLYNTTNDRRKYRIVRRYIKYNWQPFITIQMRVAITALLLRLDFHDFSSLISKITKRSNKATRKKLSSFEKQYTKAHNAICKNALPKAWNQSDKSKPDEITLYWNIYFKFLPKFCEKLKNLLQTKFGIDSYTITYQTIGDNIRSSGMANSHTFKNDAIFTLPRLVNRLIKLLRAKNPSHTFITIDAIRNPFEAYFFHQRYSGFYLVSINTPNEERLRHLRESHKFSEKQISALDNKEYPKRLSGRHIFTSQNIQRCIEISDIHLNNPERHKFDNNALRSQLFWYISLILHPGIVTPTSMERGMQLAYSAKLNSGCISRQVGAVVTDKYYSVKAIGWNNTPEGQTPCIFRSVEEILSGGEREVYSHYERTNERFQSAMRCTFTKAMKSKKLKGRNLSYCFKDVQNTIDDQKNQVHTRSLHAEENAFLQISKYGGGALHDGHLFSTASPCELCSKKAYQLGLKKVIYIDPYPGIANDHILRSGSNRPEMILFSGAVGRAYHRLYQPLMPYKDELEMLTGLVVKDRELKNKYSIRLSKLEKRIEEIKELSKECT